MGRGCQTQFEQPNGDVCVWAFASSKNSNIINFHCEWRFLCGMPMHATERIRVK